MAARINSYGSHGYGRGEEKSVPMLPLDRWAHAPQGRRLQIFRFTSQDLAQKKRREEKYSRPEGTGTNECDIEGRACFFHIH